MTTTQLVGTANGTITSGGTGTYGYALTFPNTGWSTISYGHGVDGNVESGLTIKTNAEGKISPNLYIKHVKSKLTKIQQKKLKIRLAKLQKLVRNAHDMGQTTMYENLSAMLAVVIRESEAVVCGINSYVDREWINKYMYKVKENPVKFGLLKDFPRTIPDNIRKQIKSVQARKLFDDLHVLYLDYTGQDTRDTKEKIRQKDPILFGTYSYQPNRFYYICDWIDAHCDLTMEKFVDKIKEEDPEFALAQVPEMDENMFELIKKEVKDRADRLSGTNPSNYRGLMAEEEKAKSERKLETSKKSWLKRILGK